MPSPARRSSPASSVTGRKSKKTQSVGGPKKPALSAADASLQDWSSLMNKKGEGGGSGNKNNNFVSLLDANALKGVKGKSKKGGKGGLLGRGGGDDDDTGPGDKACAVCGVTDGSVYPPFPHCETTIDALAAIARYNATKPKKKEEHSRRGGSPKRKSESAKRKKTPKPKSRTSAGDSPPNSATAAAAGSGEESDEELKTAQMKQEASLTIRAGGGDDDGELDEDDERANARAATAHINYCLTCRCLYDEERHGWMQHKICERCLYCTHGYCDVRTLDLTPKAALVCEDGLPVPKSYGEVRLQAEKHGVHWVMPLSESEVLLGRPDLLPPEARDFKSAMRRAEKKKEEIDPEQAAALAKIVRDEPVVREFDYRQSFYVAVCQIVVASESFRRTILEAYCQRNLIREKIVNFDEFAESFMGIATKYYVSQLFLMLEKCKQEAKKLRIGWQDRVKQKKEQCCRELEQAFADLEKERNSSFDDIWIQIVMSRKEMIKKFPSKEIFDVVHSEATERTNITSDESNRRYILWLTTMNLPNFVAASCNLQKEAFESVKAKQHEIWKELNLTRVAVGADKMFDEFGHKKITTSSMITKLWLQLECEADKITMKEITERQGRWELRNYFMRGKLVAIEGEKRRNFHIQRENFMIKMITVREQDERQRCAHSCAMEFSRYLSRLKKQAKSEGLFPDKKKKKEEDENELGKEASGMFGASKSSKFKLVIPKIPYKKPAAPVPAASTFIADVQANLTRAFSGVDEILFSQDGRIGLVSASEDADGAALAKDRVNASFFPVEGKKQTGSGGVSVMKESRRVPLHGVQYVDPNSFYEKPTSLPGYHRPGSGGAEREPGSSSSSSSSSSNLRGLKSGVSRSLGGGDGDAEGSGVLGGGSHGPITSAKETMELWKKSPFRVTQIASMKLELQELQKQHKEEKEKLAVEKQEREKQIREQEEEEDQQEVKDHEAKMKERAAEEKKLKEEAEQKEKDEQLEEEAKAAIEKSQEEEARRKRKAARKEKQKLFDGDEGSEGEDEEDAHGGGGGDEFDVDFESEEEIDRREKEAKEKAEQKEREREEKKKAKQEAEKQAVERKKEQVRQDAQAVTDRKERKERREKERKEREVAPLSGEELTRLDSLIKSQNEKLRDFINAVPTIEEYVTAQAGVQLQKVLAKRRGGKKDHYDPFQTTREIPTQGISCLSFVGEVGMSLKSNSAHHGPGAFLKSAGVPGGSASSSSAGVSSPMLAKLRQAAINAVVSSAPNSTSSPSQSPAQSPLSPPTKKKKNSPPSAAAASASASNNNNNNNSPLNSPSTSPLAAAAQAVQRQEELDKEQREREEAEDQQQKEKEKGQEDEDQGKELEGNNARASSIGGESISASSSSASLLHEASSSASPPPAGLEVLEEEDDDENNEKTKKEPKSLQLDGETAENDSKKEEQQPPLPSSPSSVIQAESSLEGNPSFAATAAAGGGGMKKKSNKVTLSGLTSALAQTVRDGASTVSPSSNAAALAALLSGSVDRSILSSNYLGRPTTQLHDDETSALFFMNSIRRDEVSVVRSDEEAMRLLKLAMDRVCVPPPPRHKRERKPAWVESRAAEIFKNAQIPALPPPPPPPPKAKPKPKLSAEEAKRKQREKAEAEGDGKGKKKVKFTEEGEELEFPEGKKTKPKRAAQTADPALLKAMSASQNQREMMRAMSMQASGEDGAKMEGAAFGMGLHDEGAEDGSGSAFSLLLANALNGPKPGGGGKSKGNRAAAAASSRRKALGR